jgi:hypothetical protein
MFRVALWTTRPSDWTDSPSKTTLSPAHVFLLFIVCVRVYACVCSACGIPLLCSGLGTPNFDKMSSVIKGLRY